MSSVLRLLGPVVVMAMSEGAAQVREIGGVDGLEGADEVVLLVAREVYRVLATYGARSSPTVPMDEAHIASGSSAA